MWMDLMISWCDGKEKPLIIRYHVEGEDAIDLPSHVSTPAFIPFFMDKVKLEEDDFIEKGSARVNMRIANFHQFVSAPFREGPQARTVATPAPEKEPILAKLMFQMIQL